MKTAKEWIPLALSILALAVSITSFYVTSLRTAYPYIRIGSPFHIYHEALTGSPSLVMAVSISNSGARLVTIERLGVLVRKQGANDGYLLVPFAFQKINEKGDFQNDSLAGPMTVSGGSELTKQILFTQANGPDTDYSLTVQGRYELTLFSWLSGADSPRAVDKFEFDIDQVSANKLSHWRDLQVPNSVPIERQKWNDWRPGRIEDIRKLTK
ncbi:MAG TPA: hypothetical protein VGL11_05835 [Candidatus Binatia bacterium]|jgi:hypothetical protein